MTSHALPSARPSGVFPVWMVGTLWAVLMFILYALFPNNPFGPLAGWAVATCAAIYMRFRNESACADLHAGMLLVGLPFLLPLASMVLVGMWQESAPLWVWSLCGLYCSLGLAFGLGWRYARRRGIYRDDWRHRLEGDALAPALTAEERARASTAATSTSLVASLAIGIGIASMSVLKAVSERAWVEVVLFGVGPFLVALFVLVFAGYQRTAIDLHRLRRRHGRPILIADLEATRRWRASTRLGRLLQHRAAAEAVRATSRS